MQRTLNAENPGPQATKTNLGVYVVSKSGRPFS